MLEEKGGDQQGKRSETLSEVKLVETVNNNPKEFSRVISPVQKEVVASHKLQDHDMINRILVD